jgi:hypothetical protein
MLNQSSGVDGYLENAALSNLDAKHPVLFGISGSVGHEIVGDGYGYSGTTLYVHLNMGWAGSYNAWYNLPSFTAYYTFNMLDSIVYNVFPTSTVEVISGRVLDSSGSPVSNATVTATRSSTVVTVASDSRGIYALLVPRPQQSASYQVVASLDDRSVSTSVSVSASKSTTYSYNPSTGDASYYPGTGTVGSRWATT